MWRVGDVGEGGHNKKEVRLLTLPPMECDYHFV